MFGKVICFVTVVSSYVLKIIVLYVLRLCCAMLLYVIIMIIR